MEVNSGSLLQIKIKATYSVYLYTYVFIKNSQFYQAFAYTDNKLRFVINYNPAIDTMNMFYTDIFEELKGLK